MIKKQDTTRRNHILPRLFPLFLIFMAAVSGTYLALQLFGRNADASQSSLIPQIVTVEIIITATPDPSRQQMAVTATNRAGQVDLPADLAIPGDTGDVGSDATLDPARLDAVGLGSGAPNTQTDDAVFPVNCIFHSVVSGDTVSGVAEQYGVNFFVMLEVNDLTLNTAVNLQIGDTLLVPLEGCTLDSKPTATPEAGLETLAPGASGKAAPTMTLASAAESAQIEIIEVEGIGDITAEGIRLRNTGDAINLTGWNLTDAAGNRFSFPELVLFADAEITLYTRSGANTADTLFWGKDQPVWQDGDVLTLTDSSGQIQAAIRTLETIELE